ncbi:hypothetical protein [Streptomyces venezuelae]|uniref:hypothetical protein n=1 Tax=Streptomyces venezuelae TaxID=54571 RepID=UPI0037A9510A
MDTERTLNSYNLLGDTVEAVLTAFGLPPRLSHRAADAARVAGHYLYGHSDRTGYRLWLTSDEHAVTVAVTDYTAPAWHGAPAWLPVSHKGQLRLPDRLPTADPLGQDTFAGHRLVVHRTPDGNMRLGCRIAHTVPT